MILTIGYALVAIMGVMAGFDLTKKSNVVILEEGKISKQIKVKSPATLLIYRDGDSIQVREARSKEIKKLQMGDEK